MKELNIIQSKLVANKDKFNGFGNYPYRNLDSILNALKPILKETECTFNLTDEIILVGNRFYIKATAVLTNKDGESVLACGYAREPENKKGMDESQITGTASTYARKYAACGLLGISDGYDPDSMVNVEDSTTDPLEAALTAIKRAKSKAELQTIWANNGNLQGDVRFVTAINAKNDKVK